LSWFNAGQFLEFELCVLKIAKIIIMERKEFLKKGLMGTGMFVATAALGNVIKNEVDELKELEVVGFNHIPNANSEQAPDTVLHKANTRGQSPYIQLCKLLQSRKNAFWGVTCIKR
jgi:hypothetical protein